MTGPNREGTEQEVATTWARTRAASKRVGPIQQRATTRRPGCATPRGPWFADGAVTLLPTSGSAHLSAGGASTFSFLGFGSPSAAAIFALPPNFCATAHEQRTPRSAPLTPHYSVFPKPRPRSRPFCPLIYNLRFYPLAVITPRPLVIPFTLRG